jgi:outer membrane receptor protein involved in Fe transport
MLACSTMLVAPAIASATGFQEPGIPGGGHLPTRQPAIGAPVGRFVGAATPIAKGPEKRGVEEIVVTARKKRENLRDVPVSIQAISGAQLTSAKITQVIDLVKIAPTLTESYGLTAPFVEIRGFGSGGGQSFDQAVGKFVDNISYGRDQDVRLPLFDLDRVEVLKGPQVLLYGNSTTAGALNITTTKPSEVFTGYISSAYDFIAHDSVTQGAVNLPISDTVAIRLAGQYEDLAHGWDTNTAIGEHVPSTQNNAGRATLRYRPNEELEVILKAEYDVDRDRGLVGEPLANPLVGPPFVGGTSLNGSFYAPSKVAPLYQANFNSLNNQTYQADINYKALGGTFTSTTGYRTSQFAEAANAPAGGGVSVFAGYIAYTYKQLSEELRYSGHFGPVDVLAGGFYQYEDRVGTTVADFNFPAVGVPFPPFALGFVSPERTDTYSGFADFTYHLTDQLSLEAGARYSDVSRTADQSANIGNLVPSLGFGSGAGAVSPNAALDSLYPIIFGEPSHYFTDLRMHEDHFQPQIILQYKVTPLTQVYAKYVKGDKAGGFDTAYQGVPGNVSPAGAHFGPESAASYEVGVKGITSDRKFDFSVDAYRTDFKNLQAQAYVGVATVDIVTNVGAARTQGLEAEIHYNPLSGLVLSANGAYTDAEYLDFPGGVCTRAQSAAAPAGCVQDLSNTSTPFSSRFAGSLGAEYTYPVRGYTLVGGAQLIGRSSFNVSTNNEPLLEQKGYVTLDAHLDLKPDNSFWTFSIFGRDLNDERYLEYGSISPGTANGLIGFLSRGRQLGFRAGASF